MSEKTTGGTTVGGFTCALCNAWVSYGAYHNCVKYPTYPITYTTDMSETNQLLERIIELLSIIVDENEAQDE